MFWVLVLFWQTSSLYLSYPVCKMSGLDWTSEVPSINFLGTYIIKITMIETADKFRPCAKRFIFTILLQPHAVLQITIFR